MVVLAQLTLSATLLLGLAALVAVALRRSSAAARSLVWSLAIVAVLAVPLVAAVAPRLEIAVLPVAAVSAVPEPVVSAPGMPAPGIQEQDGSPARRGHEGPLRAVAEPTPRSLATDAGQRRGDNAARRPGTAAGARRADPSRPTSGPTVPAVRRLPDALAASASGWRPPADWVLVAWLTGAFLMLAQLAAGLIHVAWIARRARRVRAGALYDRLGDAAKRLGIRQGVRLLESDRLGIPVTWHYLRPCLLVPRGMRGWSAECQSAVLVHELEHVRRRDCRLHAAAQVVVALQWFNPLAWLAAHRLRVEREQACDDAVLRTGLRPSSYARHLLQVACDARRLPGIAAVALARSTRLRGRVETILDPTIGRQSPDWRTTVSFASIALALLLPIAAIQPVPAAGPAEAGQNPELGAPPATVGMPTPSTAAGGAAPIAAPRPTPGARSEPSPAPLPQRATPSLDQLVKMRIHGISPEFIAEMNDLFGPDLDIDELVTLRIHGVSGEFARAMRGAFGGLDMGDLVTARIHGVSPEYAGHMSQALGTSLTFDHLKKMRIHGVSTEFVGAMSALFGDPDVDDLVRMRIHGVSDEYARDMRGVFGDGLDLDDLVNARIHGVSPEYARRMGELLDEELDFEVLKKMRIHGVSPDWIQELHEAGYEELSAEDLIDVKIHGMDRILLKRRGGRR